MKISSATSPFLMVRAAVMAPIVRSLDSMGQDVDALLERHGMSRRGLSDPYEIVPLARYIAAFEDSATMLSNPTMGLRLGSNLQFAELGPAGIVFMSSPTLLAAIQKFSNAFESWQSGTSSALMKTEGLPIWSYRITADDIWPRRQDSEYTVASMCHMVRLVRGAPWNPVEVHFEHAPPKDLSHYRQIFRAPLRFNQPSNGLVMQSGDLALPLNNADTPMMRLMERHATDLIERDAMPQDIVEQVRSLVMRRLAREKLVVGHIAKDMGLSQRSLQRHLSDRGTSVRAIIKEVRQKRIQTFEKQEELSSAAIARAVGYADATVLWRAKRHWKK